MGSTFNRVKTWAAEILTFAELNAEYDNILDNLSPAGMDDQSTNIAAMQTTRDPYPAASESLAVSLAEELQSIRFLIKQVTGEAQWYIDPNSDIASLFAGKLNLVSKTTTYTILASDGVILCNSSGGAFTVTLPTAVGITGKKYYVKKTDTSANAVTLDANGSETIDAVVSTYLRTQNDFIMVISDGTNWQVLVASKPKRIPEYRNLIITNTIGNLVTQVDIDADALDVTLNSDIHRLHSVNLTVDITASGANGLDTGAEATSTVYALWVIYNPTTNATAGLMSVSFSAPIMPAGYTFKRLVGFCHNDSGDDIIPFYQINDRLLYDDPLDDTSILSAGGATSFADVDMSAFGGDESIVKMALIGWEFFNATDDATTSTAELRTNGLAGNGRRLGSVRRNDATPVYGQYISGEILQRLDSSLIFEYKVSTANADLNLWVNGLMLNI